MLINYLVEQWGRETYISCVVLQGIRRKKTNPDGMYTNDQKAENVFVKWVLKIVDKSGKKLEGDSVIGKYPVCLT